MPPTRPDVKDILDIWLELCKTGVRTRDASEQLGYDSAQLYRWKKKFYPDLTVIKETLNKHGQLIATTQGLRTDPEVDVSNMRVKGITTGPYGGTYVKYEVIKEDTNSIFNELAEKAKNYAPRYKKFNHKKSKDGHLLVIDLADIHIGKYASSDECSEPYNIQIAVEKAHSGFEGILSQASGYKVDQFLLPIGNDILHVDNAKSTTTSGTVLDSDGAWHEAFKAAENMYIEIIEQLMQIAPVHIMHNSSNHDFCSGWMLAQVINAWFSKASAVTLDVKSPHRKYYRYGKSLIGCTHGDGAKEGTLGALMSQANPDASLEQFPYRYFYCHHKHHKIAKDYIDVTIEYVRAISSDDAWHNRNGYISKPAAEAFLHSKDRGQLARLTHYV